MFRSLVTAGLVALAMGTALAQNLDVIKQRQQTMKGVAQAGGDLVKMSKGEAPFDAAKVKVSLQVMVDAAKTMPTLFPDDSKTGGNTEALPAIWDHKDDVTARYAKLGSDAGAAMTAVKDPASLKAALPGIFNNCGGCHETYRLKKS